MPIVPRTAVTVNRKSGRQHVGRRRAGFRDCLVGQASVARIPIPIPIPISVPCVGCGGELVVRRLREL
jgi:hypothetical protein